MAHYDYYIILTSYCFLRRPVAGSVCERDALTIAIWLLFIPLAMGNSDSKLNFRKAVIELTSKTQPVEANNETFWSQFWSESLTSVQDVFALIPATEVRALREEMPSNMATLCYKAVERIVSAAQNMCNSVHEQQTVLNCIRLLTRLIPYIFEDVDWSGFFWSPIPSHAECVSTEPGAPLAHNLIDALCDLLFCPDFTVQYIRKEGPDTAEDLQSIDSCEYIWAAGVGFATSPPTNAVHDGNKTEILKLILTCISYTMYQVNNDHQLVPNPWVEYLTSTENRHALPLFTSLLNVICSYDPVGYGVPYNHLMVTDIREPLVEVAIQVMCVCLENDLESHSEDVSENSETGFKNLFVNYLSRIHREEDFAFMLKGLTRLLNNPLTQTYLPGSCKKIQFYQEMLVLFWKMCDINKTFMFYVLKSSDVLEVLVPILYHLNDARADQSRVGMMHIGVFIILLLSGERNFGVRLNKPYTTRVPMDIPVFSGTHADLLIIVFHKIITVGHPKLQPLFDCLLTIIVNVSPYLKTLSMVASAKLLHLLEAFSTPWFLYAKSANHHHVFFLLEVFNNIIQYQFDGNSNLIYQLIRKRATFHQLANLSTDQATINKVLNKRGKRNNSYDNHDDQASSKPPSEETAGGDNMAEEFGVDEGEDDEEKSSNQKPPRHHLQEGVARVPDMYSQETAAHFTATSEWVMSWKQKLPLQTIMRLLQVLVPQVEKICIDKNLTDEGEILKFLQHGTLVGLLPVPHPILIRKYQANSGTTMWFRTYMWGIIYLRNVDPPIWYDTEVKLFEIKSL
ncbi:HID1 [Bugula neritina]|uniref:HID1 n=1 Tax=Bugula neritina TaxID=10212 RepID=A0A7J7JRC4_BUGNE|nr:HID1 [Bugula neritina]